MNRRFMIFFVTVAVLIFGGAVSSFVAAEGVGKLIPGVLTVTSRPEASVNAFAGNQGLWFFLLIGFIIFNLVGASLTGAALFWFLNREVETVKQMDPANHERWTDAFRSGRGTAQNQLPAESE